MLESIRRARGLESSERTAGAAVAAGSAETPEAECGRLTGTG